MVTIESLKDYWDNKRTTEFRELAEQIYQIVDTTATDYPFRKDWFYGKQLAGITSAEREILFARNSEAYQQIIGLACLKKTKEESKICNLFVSEPYRNQGIGTALMERAFAWLGTTEPLMTVAENKLPQFLPFAQKYGWHIKARLQGIYEPQSCELCFNGTLTKEQNEQKEQAAGATSATAHKLSTLVGFHKQQDFEMDLTK